RLPNPYGAKDRHGSDTGSDTEATQSSAGDTISYCVEVWQAKGGRRASEGGGGGGGPDPMSEPGRLTYEEFEREILAFEKRSLELGDGWTVHRCPCHDRRALRKTARTAEDTREYEAIYSDSYNVPVMHFRAWKATGAAVKPEGASWETLSQAEHPCRGDPVYVVHPCRTDDLLRKVRASSYFLAWVTSVAPMVGLRIPLEFALSDSSTVSTTLPEKS
ncbi:unnamed protein product, partial [Darwinula stevensoni]